MVFAKLWIIYSFTNSAEHLQEMILNLGHTIFIFLPTLYEAATHNIGTRYGYINLSYYKHYHFKTSDVGQE